jgi:glycosyltransferase involved in cell wall biosynthesis
MTNQSPDSNPQIPVQPADALRVSVIMPTYNAGKFIEKAIQSVLAQTYPHWELIIVDDASTDNTQAIVQSFDDTRIRYHKAERIGHPAGVRNTGLRLATGDLIAFLDSDDLYYPETLEKLTRPLLKNPELTAVYGFAFSMDEVENPLPQTINLIPNPAANLAIGEPPYGLPPDYSHSWENIVTSRISCLLSGLVLRRATWESIGFFNETLCGPEDYEFYVRMFLNNYTGVYCLSDYVYKYRIHAASLTKSPEHYQKLLSSCLTIMDWMFNRAGIPEHVRSYESRAYMGCYRYLARERLLHNQQAICRQILLQAMQDKHINPIDLLRQCGSLLLRSFLPAGLDGLLVKVRWHVRQVIHFRSPNIQIHAM